MKNKFYLYDNQYFKWTYADDDYLLHIHRDTFGDDSPRDWDNVGTMACWHRRYNLGDDIGNVDFEEYWQDLVRKFVPEEEIFNALLENKCTGIRVRRIGSCYDIYETSCLATALGNSEPEEYLEYEEMEKDQVVYCVMDDLTIKHCQTLLAPYITWLPLYLYDHGGITISTGAFSCPWDSGQVGFIWVSKEKTIKEGLGKILDDGHCITANEENWREVAEYHLEAETEIYDTYLRGEVYWYELKRFNDGDWEDYDSCGGFFGDNLYENGILDNAAGLREALESGEYTEGEAEKHLVVCWTYD